MLPMLFSGVVKLARGGLKGRGPKSGCLLREDQGIILRHGQKLYPHLIPSY